MIRMTPGASLDQFDVIAFITVRNVDAARTFYRDTLGLQLVSEELPFALVFDAHGTMLRLAISPQWIAQPGTVLGWQVPDIENTVKGLREAGVTFLRFEGMPQDELGVWATPTGAKVAWFSDPDENTLSISQLP